MANGTGNGNDSNKGQISVIVRTLAAVVLLCVLGIFCLIYNGKTIPTELWLLTSNAFTALTTMLVKTTPSTSTQEVKVTNEKKDPVPTEPATQPTI